MDIYQKGDIINKIMTGNSLLPLFGDLKQCDKHIEKIGNQEGDCS